MYDKFQNFVLILYVRKDNMELLQSFVRFSQREFRTEGKRRYVVKKFKRFICGDVQVDRIFRGYVVDMIKVEFMEFPVFNVADCFITCGCIALFLSLVFFNKEFWKDEKK